MKQLLTFLILCVALQMNAQKQKTENLIVVTLDGFRWEEIFGGADPVIIRDSTFTQDREGMQKLYWDESPTERRKKLMPFLWNTIGSQGQLYGNRWIGNEVNNANKYWFSYPGYNEIFTGYPDDSVNSNDKIWNKNVNVLEYINKQPSYKGKVAAFATWDVIPYVLNYKRSGIYANADTMSFKFNTPTLKLLDDMQKITARPIDVRPDLITYFAAREYLKAYQPKVLYISFDETDDFAHAGLYDQYLKAGHAEDAMIGDIWNLVQSLPSYKGKTTLLVTCDHGRGDKVKKEWTSHGEKILDAGQIWIAAIGPDTKSEGEVKTKETLYQRQLATTMAALLGFNFKPAHPVIEPIKSIYSK